MSSQKDKFLDSAQKFIIKGQLDKALKDFEQAIALDPGDIRVRQRLAELLVRVGRQQEAISEYETIGKYFAEKNFYLKAIAAYKQIQKLAPDISRITMTLADLNVKQGLIGNALSECSNLVNKHLKSELYPEALDILNKMLEIDPDNLNTILKIAETNHAAGKHEEAYGQYCNLAGKLFSHPDNSSFYRLCEKMHALFPGKGFSILTIIEQKLAQGLASEAFPLLRDLITSEPDNLHAWRLICDSAKSLGDAGQLRVILTRMSDRFPDEIQPREELIELALNIGDAEEAHKLIEEQQSFLVEKGRHTQLERFHAELKRLSPSEELVMEQIEDTAAEGGSDAIGHDASPVEYQGDTLPSDETIGTASQPMQPELEDEWEEEIDLGLEEEFVQTVQAAEAPTVDALPAFPGTGEFDDELPEEPRVRLTILNPLPVESFLVSPQPAPAMMDQGIPSSALDELADLLESEIAAFTKPHTTPAATVDFFGMPSGETEQIAAESNLPRMPDSSSGGMLFSSEELAEFSDDLFGDDFGPEAVAAADVSSYGQNKLVSPFRKGIDAQLDEEDTESHFDLGIAYKEMGLFDEAINEFRVALRDPGRVVDCALLTGICQREKGDAAAAEEAFSQVLSLPGLSQEQLLNIKYELALLYEISDRRQEAVAIYHEIMEMAPSFRDVSHHLARLGGKSDDDHGLELIELDEESSG